MCPQAFDAVGEKGFMDFKTFKNIIDNFPRKDKPNGIKLFWLGEPMLNKEFGKFLRYASGKFMNPKGYEYITFDTNGCFLTPDTTDIILDVGEIVPLFEVSLDAITPETYAKIRIGGDFEKVMENVKYFIKRRHELKKLAPRIVLQFILMDKNYKEANKFIEYWSKFLEKYFIPGNSFHQDVIWIKRMDAPSPDEQGHYDKFFLKTTKELNIQTRNLEFVRITAPFNNNWNESEE